MGINLLHRSSDDRARHNVRVARSDSSIRMGSSRHPTDPDPQKFIIVKYESIGKFLIVLINYPNCTTYCGNKLLVYENVSISKLKSMSVIDPHFLEDYISPIARFAPTQRGWELAYRMCHG